MPLQIYMQFIGIDSQLEVQPDGSIKRAQWMRYPTFLAWAEDADLYDDWVPALGAAVGHIGQEGCIGCCSELACGSLCESLARECWRAKHAAATLAPLLSSSFLQHVWL